MYLKFHIKDEQLELYALGRIAEAEIGGIEEHLILCDGCRQRLDEIEAFARAMREALSQEPPQARSPSGDWLAWLRRPAVSMALAFVALTFVIAIFSRGPTAVPPLSTIQLTAVRGEMPSAKPAREIGLTLTDAPRESGPFRIEVVDMSGFKVWNGLADSSPRGVELRIQQRLIEGDYFVRLYSADGRMLHEYGFRIRN